MFKRQNENNIASINDGFLIITLTKSNTPVVWRLELEKAKVAAFEINEQDDKHTLSIKVTRKSIETIAVFNQQEDALEALLAISSTLQNAPQTSQAAQTTNQQAAPVAQSTPTVATNKNNRTAIALLATCLVLGLFYYYWGRLMPTTQVFEAQSISNISNSDPATQTGVPVSADDLLKGF